MNTKIIIYLSIVLIILTSFFLVTKTLNAQRKEGPTVISDTSAQLQQIIQNQQVILSKINDMKEELRIIKVRTAIRR